MFESLLMPSLQVVSMVMVYEPFVGQLQLRLFISFPVLCFMVQEVLLALCP